MPTLRIGLNLKLISFTVIIVALTSSITAFFPYKQQKKDLENKLSTELLGIVRTSAVAMDIDSHENIFFDIENGLEGKQYFTALQQKLAQISDSNELHRENGLSPLYTLRKSPWDASKLEFVVMTNPNAQGQFYTGALVEKQDFHDNVFKGKSETTGIYEDSEGLWITAAAPLRDKNGNVVAIVQADRHIEFYQNRLATLRNNFLVGAFIGLAIGIFLALLFANKVIAPIQQLLVATRHFLDENYSYKITQKRSDEFGELFISFNQMTKKLTLTLSELSASNKEHEDKAIKMESMALFAKLDPGPALRVEVTGIIQTLNDPAKTLFGLTDSGAANASISGYIRHLPQEKLANIIEHDRHQIIVDNIGGRWIQFVIQGVKNFNFANIYGSDITDQINAENAAKEAQRQAELSNAAKSRFLQTMSHELITPLNTISGHSQLASRISNEEKTVAHLNKISVSSSQLLELTNNILDYVKIESDDVDLVMDTINLAEIETSIWVLFGPLFRQKKVDFFVYVDPTIQCSLHGDQRKIQQILNNIVSNALKFTSQGSVFLSIKPQMHAVAFEIQDSGIGIADSFLAQAFDPFSQADQSSTRKHDGAGLGLCISQKLADKMGAKIHIQSLVPCGTSVTLTLPSAGITHNNEAITHESFGKADACSTPTKSYVLTLTKELNNRTSSNLNFKIVDIAQPDESGTTIQSIKDAESSLIIVFTPPKFSSTFNIQGKHIIVIEKPFSTSEFFIAIDKIIALDTPFNMPKIEAVNHVVPASIADSTSHDAPMSEPLQESASWDTQDWSEIDSEADTDTTFVIDEVGITNTKKHILVAEDSLINQELIDSLLSQLNYSYTLVEDGETAVETSLNEHFDAILMDIEMPILNGLEASKLIVKKHSQPPPIIAITAHDVSDRKAQYNKAGIFYFINKPFEYHEFDAVLKAAMEKNPTAEGERFATNIQTTTTPNFENIRELLSDSELEQSLRDFISNLSIPLNQQSVPSIKALLYNHPLLLTLPELNQRIDMIFGHKDNTKIEDEVNRQITTLQEMLNTLLERCALELRKYDNQNVDAASLIEGFDTDNAIKRMGGKVERYSKMCGLFYSTYQSALQKPYIDVQTLDHESIIREAHSLKGAAGTIGAIVLEASAKEVELNYSTTHTASSDLLEKMEKDLQAALEKINRFVHSSPQVTVN